MHRRRPLTFLKGAWQYRFDRSNLALQLDRLSRSVLHLVTLGADLREREIGLHVIEQGIDTSTMEGRAMFGMLSVLAELQRELIVANTNDGLAAARARGRVGGRRPKLTADQAALRFSRSALFSRRELLRGPGTTATAHLSQGAKSQPSPSSGVLEL